MSDPSTSGAPNREPSGESLALDLVLLNETAEPELLDQADVADLARCVLDAEGAVGAWEVSVVLVNDDRLRQLHRDFMQIDEPTDVMTFPRDSTFDAIAGGDIVISVDRARDQAGEHGNSLPAELVFLAVHGLLHLTGWEDEPDASRIAMLDRQTVLIEQCAEG